MDSVSRFAAALFAIVLGFGTGACGDDQRDGDVAASGDDVAVDAFPLPFGLDQLDGTEPVGRPAVFDDVPYTYNGVPVSARTLQAAYRVTGDDAPGVLQAWAAQLDGVALDEVSISPGDGSRAPWLEATAFSGSSDSDTAHLELWMTADGPILLVSVRRISDDPPRSPTMVDDAGSPPAPGAADLGAADRDAGDVLFTEQGDDLHLPEGTRALMATIPTFGGTGGSTSVLAAEDGETAVRALLDEAKAIAPEGDADEPDISRTDDTEVVTGQFVIPAGGWGFDVVSIQAPEDPHATVYVTSAAD